MYTLFAYYPNTFLIAFYCACSLELCYTAEAATDLQWYRDLFRIQVAFNPLTHITCRSVLSSYVRIPNVLVYFLYNATLLTIFLNNPIM